MTAKTARVYTLDELKEKCRKALADPGLVDIVKTAPLNKDGKVNLSWVYKQAEDYVHGQTKDLKKTKELAVETRFLAMLRRDFNDEFERSIVSRDEQIQDASSEESMELEFSPFSEIRTRCYPDAAMGVKIKQSVRLSGLWDAGKFAAQLLEELTKREFTGTLFGLYSRQLRDCAIQLLEEKFGLRIKICESCEHEKKKLGIGCEPPDTDSFVGVMSDGEFDIHRFKTGFQVFSKTCPYWALKKAPADKKPA